jgi:hypothetical protein
MTALRVSAFVVGIALLGATAHVTIHHTGGYGSAHAALTLAIAAGVGVGALCIGAAWAAQRIGLATWLVLAICAGEAFGFLSTAERLVVAREALQAPLRVAQEAFTRARARVAEATQALAALPGTSPRLDAALAAKTAADAAAVAKSAERGCAENCRRLLQAQVDASALEVDAARAEVDAIRKRFQGDLVDAHVGLTRLQVPISATPLADRLGLPAWFLDLLTAGLGSIAANGLACGLIAFAAHDQRTPQASGQPSTVTRRPITRRDLRSRHSAWAARSRSRCFQVPIGAGARARTLRRSLMLRSPRRSPASLREPASWSSAIRAASSRSAFRSMGPARVTR